LEKPKIKYHFGDQTVDGNIILKILLKVEDHRMDCFIWFRKAASLGFLSSQVP
jgi:hypothetical protein